MKSTKILFYLYKPQLTLPLLKNLTGLNHFCTDVRKAVKPAFRTSGVNIDKTPLLFLPGVGSKGLF
jgi:hypothetical protein